MVVFLDEEGAYLAWLKRHRSGFVLDSLRRPTRKQPTLHRATCEAIRKSATKKTHWTTGRRLKACSLDVDQLAAWANDEFGAEPAECERCEPRKVIQAEEVLSAEKHDHLTKLGKEMLDYVIESAVIHLDQGDLDYHLTVGDVAGCVGKTPAQITAALMRLVEDGYLRMEGEVAPGAALSPRRKIYPTAAALRTLPAFEKVSDRKIEAELKQLASS